jgi:hypothetical protein
MRLKLTALATALVVSLVPAVASAHGGGGGGGGGHGGGGHYVYVPVYMGDAGPPVVPAAKTGDYSGIKTVAIVTAVAQRLTLGSKALLSSHKDIDVSDWNLDPVVEATVAKYLSGRFTVKTIPYDRAALAAIPNSHFDSNSDKIADDYLSKLPADGIDAFVVIRPDAEMPGPITDGLSLDSSGGYYLRPVEMASYEIDIVARDGRKIAHSLSRIATRKGAAEEFPVLFAPPGLALTDKDTPSKLQRAMLKNEYARLLALSLRQTLRSLNLGITLPEVGARDLIPIPPDKNPLTKLHTVAVVSAVGDRLDLNHRGALFRHSLTTAPVAEWNLDGEIEAGVTAALDKRLKVRAVTVDRAKLASVEVGVVNSDLSTPIAGLTPTSGVDAYIVVLKRKTAVGMQADPVSGLGLWNQNGLGGESSGVFADFAVAIVDPQTLKPHWLQAGVTSPAKPGEAPISATSNTNWPKDGGAPTPEQSAALHKDFADMMADAVPETMYRMMLTGVMPAPVPGVTEIPTETLKIEGPLPPAPAPPTPGPAPSAK